MLPRRVRAARLFVSDPREGLDRVLNTLERVVAERRAGTASASENYPVTADWLRALHRLMDVPWPCPEDALFDDLWGGAVGALDNTLLDESCCHDSGPGFARAAWCVARHLQAERVVETGVARGITTRFVLEALARNDRGRLWSVDLPPLLAGWGAQVGSAVPAELRHRWTYVRGSSRRRLPSLLSELPGIDVFIHDSLHTERNMRFEMELAWPSIRPGGILIADNIIDNLAFEAFIEERGDVAALIPLDRGRASFGVALKTAPPPA